MAAAQAGITANMDNTTDLQDTPQVGKSEFKFQHNVQTISSNKPIVAAISSTQEWCKSDHRGKQI